MRDQQGDSIREAWVICLILGMIMINFPFIQIFNNNQLIFGIPVLILYFFAGWPASILIIWFFVRQIELENHREEDKSGRRNLP